MLKKILGLGIGALVALSVPAVAGAHEITDPGGSVSISETVTAVSTNTKIHLGSGGTMECTAVFLNGTVQKNSGGEVLIEMDGANDSASHCTMLGSEFVVAPTLTQIFLNGETTLLSSDLLVNGICPESSTSKVTYMSGATSIHVEGILNGPAGCINGASITGDFEVFDSNGQVEFH